ncbi:MAG: hypothetical protein JW732_05745 [Dehalococcoidia bacterium]|nr:hypothetical protein [Dehalococcoidia bacterium]
MPQVSEENRLKILFLPAWYPSEVNPVGGVFVKEQAKRASLYKVVELMRKLRCLAK